MRRSSQKIPFVYISRVNTLTGRHNDLKNGSQTENICSNFLWSSTRYLEFDFDLDPLARSFEGQDAFLKYVTSFSTKGRIYDGKENFCSLQFCKLQYILELN